MKTLFLLLLSLVAASAAEVSLPVVRGGWKMELVAPNHPLVGLSDQLLLHVIS